MKYFNIFMTKNNEYYNKKLQRLRLNVFFPSTLKVVVWVLIRYGSFFIFFHLRDVLIYIFSPKKSANFRRGCIIKAFRYTNSDTILYSDGLFITLLDTIVISSDNEIDDYKSDGNISDKNNLE